MAISRSRGAIGVLIAGSLLFSSTGAVAAASVPTYQPDPWAVLSAMIWTVFLGPTVGAIGALAGRCAGLVGPAVDALRGRFRKREL